MGYFEIIYGALGGLAGILAIITFFPKQLLTHLFRKDLEAHKNRLKSESDQQLEALKIELKAKSDIQLSYLNSRLEKNLHERSVCFETLHAKRAELIAELYEKFIDAQSLLSGSEFLVKVTDMGPDDKSPELINLKNFFRKKRIFFSKDICTVVLEFLEKINNPYTEYKYTDIDGDPKAKQRLFMKSCEEAQAMSYRALTVIEAEFRTLLGV